MGTPEFAVPSLDTLVTNGYHIIAVITSTDKLGGRGKKKLLESPIKKYALSKGIEVLQPKNLKDPKFLESLKALNANLQIVVAFRMLPEAVWNMPEYGTYNLHGSLLPKYRGAAPINWAIINGEKETGVTTFKLKHAIDTGDMVLQKKMNIDPHDTAGDIHDRMKTLGAEAVLETVKKIEDEEISFIVQDHGLATKAPKIFSETCEIDICKKGKQVHDFIRGLSPYPAAWMVLDGKKMKILKSTFELEENNLQPGTLKTDQRSFLKIKTEDGYISLLEVQLEGRKRMRIDAFLRGYKIISL